ncbi:phosphatidylserine decarboxylase family protein [Thermincola potens]|uniref:Phosphatidylserine decarboxylase proenzyme n=1 Tax=Thermincola potens (strain JR) TaxID=635013 RepID=D5X887_THEPJ|nr:phosphatidylserine decarboxylase family protein [Thermincola potens]ADG82807.1 phosphatidylserine decarboxylase related protein [Thermincola potens JR]
MNQPYIIAKEGFPCLAILAVVTVATYLFRPWVAIIPGILFLFVAFFFRNPKRIIPTDKEALVSPADGTVMSIEEIEEKEFLRDKAIKVSIFLSIFNVHLNRCPMEGEIKYINYRPGKFIPAFKSHASDINEKNFVGIENDRLKIMVTQITGFIARRIVCWVKPGDKVAQGDLFGLIKFGSCTELIVPKNVEIKVKPGQKVVGGITVIGRLKNEY